jgi:hypothetical protein
VEEGKEGNHVKDGETRSKEHLNIIGLRKEAGSGQKPPVMEEDCIGSQGNATHCSATATEEEVLMCFLQRMSFGLFNL